MTDYIAFDKENKVYSIYDIEKILKDIPDYKPDLYCICKEPIYYKKNSIEFINKKGHKIQRINHFSHYPNSKCDIKVIQSTKNKADKTNDAPEKTEIEKRINRIMDLLWFYNKSCKNYNTYKGECELIIKNAKKHKINYEPLLSPFIIKLISIKTNNKYISYKDIESLEIEENIKYNINEFSIFILDIKDRKSFNNNFIYPKSFIYTLCNDFDRYIKYLKNLSLIIVYYSRCIKGNDTMKKETNDLKNQIQYKIEDNLKCMFIDD